MIYTRKLTKGTHGTAGQTAIHMEGRGLVATMEAGHQAARDYDADEIHPCTVNADGSVTLDDGTIIPATQD